MTRARTAYLPLMLQLAGITRSSGNKASRISRSRSARHAAPSRAPSFFATRNSRGAAKQPFHSPWRSSLARASSAWKRPLAEASTFRRKTVADQQLAEACRFALDLADAEVPLLVGGIGAEIVAANLLAAGQFCQLIARLDATGPHVGVLVDAELVERSGHRCRRADR